MKWVVDLVCHSGELHDNLCEPYLGFYIFIYLALEHFWVFCKCMTVLICHDILISQGGPSMIQVVGHPGLVPQGVTPLMIHPTLIWPFPNRSRILSIIIVNDDY